MGKGGEGGRERGAIEPAMKITRGAAGVTALPWLDAHRCGSLPLASNACAHKCQSQPLILTSSCTVGLAAPSDALGADSHELPSPLPLRIPSQSSDLW